MKEQKIRPTKFNLFMLETKKTGQSYLPFYMEWPVCLPISRPNRNDDGIPTALDRLKAHGNAVVPQQFYPVAKAIADIERGLTA